MAKDGASSAAANSWAAAWRVETRRLGWWVGGLVAENASLCVYYISLVSGYHVGGYHIASICNII